MSQPHPEAEPLVQDELQAAQDARNPPEGPLPPIPDKKPVWHAGQVRNARYLQRFFHDPAKFDARKFITPSDLAAAGNIEGYYSDVQENELRWPASWETDAAPLKRILAHSSWKDALRRCGIDPPDRNGPGNGKDNSGDGVENGLGNGIDNISDGVGNGAGGGFDNATNHGAGVNGSGNGMNNGSSFIASSNGINNGAGFSEEDLSNNFAGAHISNSNIAQSQYRPENYLGHHASNSNNAEHQDPTNGYPDLQRIVNSNNPQNQNRPNNYLGQHNGGIFNFSGNRVNNGGTLANSNADQNRAVNSIDTQNHTYFNNSLGQHASNNGGGFNLRHRGPLHIASNSSQHLISSSKPFPYTMEPATGPKTVDAAYNDPAGGQGRVGAPADQALPAPRPIRVDQRPAVLDPSNRNDEAYKASQNRRFDRWWDALSPERRREIVEDSKQAVAREDGANGNDVVWVQ